mmetsp:Transcript_11412/g.19188  ORF Transcript_11412/g.19188 Transcript_11412/m.19188 type:complete len:206 (+) Transcript_11412:450-1067(+)
MVCIFVKNWLVEANHHPAGIKSLLKLWRVLSRQSKLVDSGVVCIGAGNVAMVISDHELFSGPLREGKSVDAISVHVKRVLHVHVVGDTVLLENMSHRVFLVQVNYAYAVVGHALGELVFAIGPARTFCNSNFAVRAGNWRGIGNAACALLKFVEASETFKLERVGHDVEDANARLTAVFEGSPAIAFNEANNFVCSHVDQTLVAS